MAKKINPQTLKGFRDFLPPEAIKRRHLVGKIKRVFELYGYDPIETPALEYLETFEGQIGEEEKLFYKFQDQGGRRVALRYDQTVPTCRLVAQYPEKISLPFKRYQIQTVWRAEKPQKGRYRELLQCDADIFGVAAPEADAEVIALSMDIYRSLGFKEIRTLINDRSLFAGIPYPVISAVDKLKKIGQEAVLKEIEDKGFSPQEAAGFLKKITAFRPTPVLEAIFAYLKAAGFSNSWYQFAPTLARAFSYSTGPIWEIEIPRFGAGSVLGGERYDRLVGTFTQKSGRSGREDIPGTGFGLGFDRTLEAMETFGLLNTPKTLTRVLVTVFSPKLLADSLQLASILRKAGINTDVYSNPASKLDKQLKYADRKGIPFVTIIGPEEVKGGQATLREMKTGEQQTFKVHELVSFLNSRSS